jgi:hypothetical protein
MSVPAQQIEQIILPPPLVKAADLAPVSAKYTRLFNQFISDRLQAEQRWLRNLRQYLGLYDPEIERQLGNDRSKAYPRITRVKTISVVARVMNLMFPGNERNWALSAGPEPDLSQEDVMQALQTFMQKQQEAGIETPPTEKDLRGAMQELAAERAERLSQVIDDYLQELGGDQTQDYITLNRQVVMSGVLYGTGVLLGPFARTQRQVRWVFDEQGLPFKTEAIKYKPQFEFLPVWDYYPDMSAKNLRSDDGYFVRRIMSKRQVRALGEREGFFGHIVDAYLRGEGQSGNYRPRQVDTELRTLGLKINVNETKANHTRYEVITWYGPVEVKHLMAAGLQDIPLDMLPDDELPAEVWMVGNSVIAVIISPWYTLGADVHTCHTFIFDEDDTSPLGNGLPNVMRDSQLSVCAASRMLLDNASVVCGPQLELNTDLLRPDQDLTSVHAYKRWYREGSGGDAQQPAVRNISIDSHIQELLQVIRLFMDFADAETFVGPATGGDMSRGPSEPLRTAAGASMLRGDAALPFKDIVRNFDMFTQSVIQSLVWFCRKLGQHPEAEGDFNVIARGATSLISKEIRGVQVDNLAATLRPEEMEHVDPRKMVEKRFEVRDLTDMLLSQAEVTRKQQVAQQKAAQQEAQQAELIQATIRDTLASAFKDIAQGQKNIATTEKTRIDAVQATLGQLRLGGGAEAPQLGQPEQPSTEGVPFDG